MGAIEGTFEGATDGVLVGDRAATGCGVGFVVGITTGAIVGFSSGAFVDSLVVGLVGDAVHLDALCCCAPHFLQALNASSFALHSL